MNLSTNDRYAPPTAIVADAERPEVRPPRPPSVDLAMALLWMDLGFGIISFLIALFQLPLFYLRLENLPRFFLPAIVITLARIGICVWLFIKVGEGRNWARITLLIVMLLLGPLYFANLDSYLGLLARPVFPMVLVGIFGLLGPLLIGTALVLLFVSGRAWFREPET